MYRNAATLHHTGRINADETIAYIQKYSGVDEQRAKQSFRFITDPLSRSYIFTYTVGYDLIDNATNGDKTDLFKRLLTEPMLPSDLASQSKIGQ